MATSIANLKEWAASVEPVCITDVFEIEEVSNHKEDPLVLSCVIYRLKKEPVEGMNPWELTLVGSPKVLIEQITPEDRTLAETIRRHYNDKIVLTTLRGDRITNFRGSLSEFLNKDFKKNNQYEVPNKFLGMLYKLPYFYHYDLEVNEVFGSAYHELKGKILNYTDDDKKLTFISKVKAYRKGHNPNEYWFSDRKGDRFVLTIEANNALVSLFDIHLTSNKNISVKGEFRAARKDTLEYYRTTRWTINV